MWSLNKFTLSLLLLSLLACGGPKKDPDKKYFDKASEYNQYISSQFDEVNRLWNSTLPVMDDSSKIYLQLDSLTTACQLSIQNMHQLADFKGDTGYKHAATEYFTYMFKMVNSSYKEAIEIGLMDDISDSLYFKYMSISTQIGADKDSCINRLKAAQIRFVEMSSK